MIACKQLFDSWRGRPSAGAVCRTMAITLAPLSALLVLAATASAHGGGTPRLTNAPAGPYRVYSWSQPEPLRQGETHLTIGVTVLVTDTAQDSQVEAAITDAEVIVTYTWLDGVGGSIEARALPQVTLGAVYYEADVEIPSPGQWQVAIAVDGTEGSGEVSFTANVEPPRKINILALVMGSVMLAGAAAVLAFRARGRNTVESPRDRRRHKAVVS